jgi:hypothetical protein
VNTKTGSTITLHSAKPTNHKILKAVDAFKGFCSSLLMATAEAESSGGAFTTTMLFT